MVLTKKIKAVAITFAIAGPVNGQEIPNFDAPEAYTYRQIECMRSAINPNEAPTIQYLSESNDGLYEYFSIRATKPHDVEDRNTFIGNDDEGTHISVFDIEQDRWSSLLIPEDNDWGQEMAERHNTQQPNTTVIEIQKRLFDCFMLTS